ncbi:hypothetical protein LWI29_006400 [Acer saccharum]|uniref:Uncharacterized protein n=1 Tax=Acer saccharum TaxID=4024 RepID=A0AA39TCA2_ACESA|nr:hypothetical protein LWI29_006400 [Acer saccharum]
MSTFGKPRAKHLCFLAFFFLIGFLSIEFTKETSNKISLSLSLSPRYNNSFIRTADPSLTQISYGPRFTWKKIMASS